MQKMNRKEQKRFFYFSFKDSLLLSPPFSSHRRGNTVHRRAVMWFQCLGPHGRVPSGRKPFRLCWHITAPIINSRSALSFLFHLSSFLLTGPSPAFASLSSMPPAPSPLLTLNTLLLISCLSNHTLTAASYCTE